jgi:hypothetical protein
LHLAVELAGGGLVKAHLSVKIGSKAGQRTFR